MCRSALLRRWQRSSLWRDILCARTPNADSERAAAPSWALLMERSGAQLWPAGLKEPDELILSVRAGRCSHEQVRGFTIVGRQQDCRVLAVAIKQPAGEQEGGPLVAFAERLGTGHPEGYDCGGRHRVFDVVDRFERPL